VTTVPTTAHQPSSWPTTRILFALAGTMTLLSVLLVITISPWFLLLTTFVGANQLVLVLAGACPASLIIDQLRRQNVAGPHASC
jgi:hypothetical protein